MVSILPWLVIQYILKYADADKTASACFFFVRFDVAAQSEIGNLRRFQLKLQFVSDKGNEFGIRGFSLGIADSIAENLCKVSRSPRSQATSMAWRIARSTLEGVVWNVLATWGYNTLVMAFTGLSAR